MCYEYCILVGYLEGFDVLLRLDWLIAGGAIIDFSKMTAILGPSQEVAICDHPSPQAEY